MRVVLLVIFVALVARLVAVQEFSHTHYASLSRSELSQIVTLPALRGGIYDRNGEVLALSVAKKTVVADPFLIKKPLQTADALSPVLGIPVAQLVPELSEHSGFVYLAHRIDSATAAKVSALGLNGIDLIDESQRVEPDGQTAQPVIGSVQADGKGGSGLEYQYQSLLAGKAGSEDLLTAPDGVALPGASSTGKAAKPGTGLELTVDESIQYVAEQALGAEIVASQATSGSAVVMDVKTGDILAMANLQATPTPTPAPASGSAAAAAQTVADTTASATSGDASVGGSASTLPAGVSESPSNAALTQVYEPGSVFKLVTFSAALASGVISPNQDFTVPDALPLGTYTFHDAEDHGTENLSATDIIAQSSNIGTIEIAEQLGENRLLNQINNLGFGKPTGLHFPGESQGLVPNASQWSGSSIGSTPIGQADAVTVQQVLDAYNAVANGGEFVAPRLVRATVAPNGSVHAEPAAATHRVIDPTTNAALVKMLESVVSTGTGVEAAIDGYTVAGKTGTAQMPDPTHGGYLPGAFVGSFAGFAPAENPVLSCIVVLNHPTPIYGGSVAAPVFSTIVQYALQHYGIPTTAAATPGTSVGAVGGAGSIVVQPGVTTEGP
jgi:cell division protein FtsI/penicillin-binding protein 2